MKPAQFAYHAPAQLDELLGLLADDGRDARVIAGGQSLVPMMNFRLSAPEELVDLRGVEQLQALRLDPASGTLSVGAAVTQARLLRDPGVRERFPLLAEGIAHIGHPQIRSRGTVCGSLAHHDPTAELPAIALAHDAVMAIASAGAARCEVMARDFFVSYYETALEPGQLLTEVVFPPLPPGAGWGFRELARRRGDFALVGAVAVVAPAASDVRLVLFGVGDKPARIAAVEQHLTGASFDEAALAEVPRLVADSITPLDDLHASADYRREVAGDLAVAVLHDAWERSSR